PLSSQQHADLQHLPSFPTRRSSDLNTSTKIYFAENASMGGTLKPEVGGPNEPNQVYVSLSGQEQTKIKRDTWDLGYYSGNGFYVDRKSTRLNSSHVSISYAVFCLNK